MVAWTYFLPLKSCTSHSTPTFSLPEECKLSCKVNNAFLLTLHTCQVVNCFQYSAVKPYTSEQWQSSGRLQLTSALRSQETSVLPEQAAAITCLFVVPPHLCKVRGRWWIQPPRPISTSESCLCGKIIAALCPNAEHELCSSAQPRRDSGDPYGLTSRE